LIDVRNEQRERRELQRLNAATFDRVAPSGEARFADPVQDDGSTGGIDARLDPRGGLQLR
jgi:hypothetical protein